MMGPTRVIIQDPCPSSVPKRLTVALRHFRRPQASTYSIKGFSCEPLLWTLFDSFGSGKVCSIGSCFACGKSWYVFGSRLGAHRKAFGLKKGRTNFISHVSYTPYSEY